MKNATVGIKEPLLTTKELARLTHLSTKTIDRYRKAGKVGCIKLSRKAIRFAPRHVEQLFASSAMDVLRRAEA